MKQHKRAFTSDQLALLGPLVTPAAVALARRRLIHDRERITAQRDKAKARVALLLVRIMNPTAHLTNRGRHSSGSGSGHHRKMKATGRNVSVVR